MAEIYENAWRKFHLTLVSLMSTVVWWQINPVANFSHKYQSIPAKSVFWPIHHMFSHISFAQCSPLAFICIILHSPDEWLSQTHIYRKPNASAKFWTDKRWADGPHPAILPHSKPLSSQSKVTIKGLWTHTLVLAPWNKLSQPASTVFQQYSSNAWPYSSIGFGFFYSKLFTSN